MSKYGNRKTAVGDRVYDSVKEAQRAQQLQLMQRAGLISDLKEQVKYELIPAQRAESTEVYKSGPQKGLPKPGALVEKACYYIADFVYLDHKTGKVVVEDTKGYRTKEYIIKRKLMLQVYGLHITEI